MDWEDIGTQLFSNLILSGWSVAQVDSVTTCEGLPPAIAMRMQRLCELFSKFDTAEKHSVAKGHFAAA